MFIFDHVWVFLVHVGFDSFATCSGIVVASLSFHGTGYVSYVMSEHVVSMYVQRQRIS